MVVKGLMCLAIHNSANALNYYKMDGDLFNYRNSANFEFITLSTKRSDQLVISLYNIYQFSRWEVNFEKKDEHYFMDNVSLDLIPNYQSQGH